MHYASWYGVSLEKSEVFLALHEVLQRKWKHEDSTCFCPLRGSPRNRDSATPPTLLIPNPRRPPSNFWPTPWGHHKRAALMPDTDKKFMKRDTVIIQWSSNQIKLRRFLKKRNGTSNNVPLSRASALLKLLQNSLTNNHCLRIESMAHFRQANLSSTGLTFGRTWRNTIGPIWHGMTGYEHAGDGSSSVVHLRWCYAVMRRYRRSDSNCSVDTISWTDIPNWEAAADTQKMSVQYTIVAIFSSTHSYDHSCFTTVPDVYRRGTLSMHSPPQYATTPAAPATVPPKPVASSEFHFPRDSRDLWLPRLPRHWNHLCDRRRQRCPPFSKLDLRSQIWSCMDGINAYQCCFFERLVCGIWYLVQTRMSESCSHKMPCWVNWCSFSRFHPVHWDSSAPSVLLEEEPRKAWRIRCLEAVPRHPEAGPGQKHIWNMKCCEIFWNTTFRKIWRVKPQTIFYTCFSYL